MHMAGWLSRLGFYGFAAHRWLDPDGFCLRARSACQVNFLTYDPSLVFALIGQSGLRVDVKPLTAESVSTHPPVRESPARPTPSAHAESARGYLGCFGAGVTRFVRRGATGDDRRSYIYVYMYRCNIHM